MSDKRKVEFAVIETRTLETKMRVIEYRRSADPQAAGLLARQGASIKAMCDANGWAIVCTHTDAGSPARGGLLTRPSLAEALQELREGKADALVTTSLSTITRDPGEAIDLFDGTTTIITTDGVNSTTAQGRMLLTAIRESARLFAGDDTV